MKMFKTIPVFILLFTGYLCNNQTEKSFSPLKGSDFTPAGRDFETSSLGTELQPEWNYHDTGRDLPTLVVAGVSIALVLLCILIVAVFWYAWKKSQEGSIELNPIPYGEAGVSVRNLSVPENQQEWPFERAVQ